MRSIYLTLLWIIIIIILNGCGPDKISPTSATPMSLTVQLPSPATRTDTSNLFTTPNLLSTELISPTLITTLKVSTNTQTVTPKATQGPFPTPSPVDWSSVPSCREETLNLVDVEGFFLPGALEYYDVNHNGFYIIGGSPLHNTQLPISGTITTDIVGFSPNGEWLAYTMIPPTIGLLSNKGVTDEHVVDIDVLFSRIPADAYICGWQPHNGWINDDLISMSICYREDNATRTVKFFMILDPFSGIWQEELLTSLPGIEMGSWAYFSPDLSRVLYNNIAGDMVLWDINNHTTISLSPSTIKNGITYDPFWDNKLSAWSFDNTSAAIIASENGQWDPGAWGVFLLGRDGGESRRITNFTQDFDSFQAYGLQWSKDSRFLAFGVSHSLNSNYSNSIYIYDTVKNNYIFQCDLNQANEVIIRWSPDNQMIAYSNYGASPLALVNLKTGEMVKVADRAIIGDWTDNLQWVSP